jgi:hypothetical protein
MIAKRMGVVVLMGFWACAAGPTPASASQSVESVRGETARLDVHFGPTAGFGTMAFDGAPPNLERPLRWAWSAGIGYEMPLGGPWWLRPELNYTQKSSGFGLSDVDMGGGTIVDLSETFHLSYVELPLVLKIRLAPEGKVRPYLVGGASAGVLVAKGASMDATIRQGGPPQSVSQDVEIDDGDVQRFEGSLHFGLGADIAVSPSHELMVDLRYVHGLTEVATRSDAGSLRNRTLALVTGFRF